MNILVITKRQYTNKDLIDDRFGRLREIPLELSRRGYDIDGLCLSYRSKPEGRFHDESVLWQSINLSILKLPGLLKYIYTANKLAKNADIIWACSDSIYGIIGFVISRHNHIPLIFDLYDNFEYFLTAKLPIIKQLYRYTLKNCSAVTCVSQPLADLVLSYGRKNNVVVLENAVRDDLFYPMAKDNCRSDLGLPSQCRLVGTAGALDDSRGIQSLFDAFEILKNRYPDLHLVLAGPRKGPLPRTERIIDLGVLPLEKMPLLFNALDVAVICNRNNEFGKYCYPQKATEIMACNVPLIAARVGSMAWRFKDHPEWLYSPDDKRNLATVLEHRLVHQNTAYTKVATWQSATEILEKTLLELK